MKTTTQILPGTGRWQPSWADGGAVPVTALAIAAPTNCPSTTRQKRRAVPLPVPGRNEEAQKLLGISLEGIVG
jgi:hypothetical protein